MNPTRSLLTAATLATGLLAAGAVTAADRTVPAASVEVATAVVSYGDLNLDSDRGVERLQRRIVAAANKVCGQPDPRNLRLAAIARQCVDEAIARAVTDVGNTRLAKLNESRSKPLRG